MRFSSQTIFSLIGLYLLNEFVFGKMEIKSCRNCIYYNANPKNLDYHSSLNKCNKFYAESAIQCRKDETTCGRNGKEWKPQPNIMLKLFCFHFEKYKFIHENKYIPEISEINNKILLEQKKTIGELIKILLDLNK